MTDNHPPHTNPSTWGEPEPDGIIWVRPMSDLDGLSKATLNALRKMARALDTEES